MFHHTVMVNFVAVDAEFLQMVEGYAGRIRGMQDGLIEFGFHHNDSSRAGAFRHAFVSRFRDSAAHDRFQTSALHEELKRLIMPRVAELVVLDYQDRAS